MRSARVTGHAAGWECVCQYRSLVKLFVLLSICQTGRHVESELFWSEARV